MTERQTDRRTESDAYESTVQYAQVGLINIRMKESMTLKILMSTVHISIFFRLDFIDYNRHGNACEPCPKAIVIAFGNYL